MVPPGLWFLLGFRVSDWPIGGEYSTDVHLGSRGSCHSPQRAYGSILFHAGGGRTPPPRSLAGHRDDMIKGGRGWGGYGRIVA